MPSIQNARLLVSFIGIPILKKTYDNVNLYTNAVTEIGLLSQFESENIIDLKHEEIYTQQADEALHHILGSRNEGSINDCVWAAGDSNKKLWERGDKRI